MHPKQLFERKNLQILLFNNKKMKRGKRVERELIGLMRSERLGLVRTVYENVGLGRLPMQSVLYLIGVATGITDGFRRCFRSAGDAKQSDRLSRVCCLD